MNESNVNNFADNIHTPSKEQAMINNFVDNINSLSKENVDEVLNNIYTQEVEFIDPVKGIKGIEELKNYFSDLYESVDHCNFDITNYLYQEDMHAIEWVMSLKHKKLSKNDLIKLNGCSFVRFENNKVCYHRDYYDLGALIYERLPLIGFAVKSVRNAF
ncbi:MAG: nuclear transport factor 2 family protein [Pseudomonadota bacterium]